MSALLSHRNFLFWLFVALTILPSADRAANDPVLSFSTYLGGENADEANGIAVDESGYIYVTGETESLKFPRKNPFQTRKGNYSDAFVAKIDPVAGSLIYSTFLGGDSIDAGYDIAVDPLGNAYITGRTGSEDFPTLNAFQDRISARYRYDAFVTKLDPQGGLVYSTYLGGSFDDRALGIAVDADSQAYVTGLTNSSDFPKVDAIQKHLNGCRDAFISKLSASGRLVYSTFLGGNEDCRFPEYAEDIAVDAFHNVYVTGITDAIDFPTKAAFQPKHAGQEIFVSKINAEGSDFIYSTYLGGSGSESSPSLAVTRSGRASVFGETHSTDFPVRQALYPVKPHPFLRDGFIAKFGPNGQLAYSTYIGSAGLGLGSNYPHLITIDLHGNTYITGATSDPDFPLVNPIQRKLNRGNRKFPSDDAFVMKLNQTGSEILFSTYLGGKGSDYANGIAVNASGAIYVAGRTSSENFPTRNPIQDKRAGRIVPFDAFVSKID